MLYICSGTILLVVQDRPVIKETGL